MHQRSVRPYIWMVAGCASFATMAAMAHELGERCNWQTVAFFRALLVLLFVGSFALATRTKLVFFRPGKLWLRSLAGSTSLVMTFYTLSKLPASTVVTLSNTFPIWVAVLSWPILGVFPAPRVWFAVAGGVAGVFLIQSPNGGEDNAAILMALAAAMATSLAMIGLHKLRGVNSNAVVVHFSAVATLAAGSSFFLFELREDATPFYETNVLFLLLGVGLTASLGQMFLTRAFAQGDPSKVAVVGLSQVIFSLAIDASILGHPLTSTSLWGTLLILVPTAWVILGRKRIVKPGGITRVPAAEHDSLPGTLTGDEESKLSRIN